MCGVMNQPSKNEVMRINKVNLSVWKLRAYLISEFSMENSIIPFTSFLEGWSITPHRLEFLQNEAIQT